MDTHRALAGPTDAAFRRPVTLENRSAVDKAALRAAVFGHERRQFFQTRANHLVVVIAPRIAADASSPGGRRQIVMEIIRGQNQYRARTRQDALRIDAIFGRALHPFHGGLASVPQPCLERVGVGRASGAGETAEGEAELFGRGADYLPGHDGKWRT